MLVERPSKDAVIQGVTDFITKVEAVRLATPEMAEVEIKYIKAKNRADSLQAKLDIARLSLSPLPPQELIELEIKAVKARKNANRLEAKLKLLQLGQPAKKKAAQKPFTISKQALQPAVSQQLKQHGQAQQAAGQAVPLRLPSAELSAQKVSPPAPAQSKPQEENMNDIQEKLEQIITAVTRQNNGEALIAQGGRLLEELQELKAESSRRRDDLADIKAALRCIADSKTAFDTGQILGALNCFGARPQFSPWFGAAAGGPPGELQSHLNNSVPMTTAHYAAPATLQHSIQQPQMPPQAPVMQPPQMPAPAPLAPTQAVAPLSILAPSPQTAAPLPVGAPAAVPAAPPPAAAPAENPMHKMLANMADKLNAMNSKLDS